ncbi:MAG: hypothetical protein ABFR90_08825 [Planctomycetota bacterium]
MKCSKTVRPKRPASQMKQTRRRGTLWKKHAAAFLRALGTQASRPIGLPITNPKGDEQFNATKSIQPHKGI